MVTFFCDRCKRETNPEDLFKIVAISTWRLTKQIDVWGGEVCYSCVGEVCNFLMKELELIS